MNEQPTLQGLEEGSVGHGDAVAPDLALLVVGHHEHDVHSLGDGSVVVVASVDVVRGPGEVEGHL